MIKTGKAPVTILTYLAIMSVCFVINLPGISIAPMEGKLRAILHLPELEVQLLTTLPNFVIIPVLLLSGKISLYKNKLPWIICALTLYLFCAIAYLFADSVLFIIIISCLLGCANGLLIPFAMGFIVNTFYGKYRTRQLGMKSAISNLSVVLGSIAVGFLINSKNWHLPFVVYLAVAIPLIFSYWLKNVPGITTELNQGNKKDSLTQAIDMKKIWALIFNNISFSFLAMAVIIYLPQLIEGFGWNPEITGEITAVFFISVLVAGFLLLPVIRILKEFTFFGIALFLLIGLFFLTFIHTVWSMYLGAVFSGMAFGIFQPFIYDKTSYAVTDSRKTIIALSFVLTALYAAIAIEPFIITGICRLFKILNENYFVFKLSFFLTIAYAFAAFVLRHEFGFSVEKEYISEPDEDMM